MTHLTYIYSLTSTTNSAIDHAARIAMDYFALIVHLVATHWIYLALAAAVVGTINIAKVYSTWKREWLSGLIEQRIRDAKREKAQATANKERHFSTRATYYQLRSGLFRSAQETQRYFGGIKERVSDIYLPSLTSFAIIFVVLLQYFSAHIFLISKVSTSRGFYSH